MTSKLLFRTAAFLFIVFLFSPRFLSAETPVGQIGGGSPIVRSGLVRVEPNAEERTVDSLNSSWSHSTMTPAANSRRFIKNEQLLPDQIKDCTGINSLIKPLLLSPIGGAQLETIAPLYQWQIDARMAAEQMYLVVKVDDEPSFTGDLVGSLDAHFDRVYPGSGEFRFDKNLEPGKTYYWRARYECRARPYPDFVYGPHSDTAVFQSGIGGELPAAPIPLAPADGTSEPVGWVALAWQPVEGAEEYLVGWQPASVSYYSNFWSRDSQEHARLSEEGKTYMWWVSTRNSFGIGPASAQQQVTAVASMAVRLIIDHVTGAPGSDFVGMGSGFPAGTALMIVVNGVELGTVPVLADGTVRFVLETEQADPGAYVVAAKTTSGEGLIGRFTSEQQVWATFRLDVESPLHHDKAGTAFAVPAGIALSDLLYLPAVQK